MKFREVMEMRNYLVIWLTPLLVLFPMGAAAELPNISFKDIQGGIGSANGLPSIAPTFVSAKVQVGIGVALSLDPMGAKVNALLLNSGADRAHIQPGDVITKVFVDNGDGISDDEVISLEGKTIEEIYSILRDDPGTTIVLGILRNGGIESIQVTRSVIEVLPKKPAE